MKNLLLVSALVAFASIEANAALERYTLKTAMEKGLVTVKPNGLGGYNGKSLALNIHNNTAKAMQLTIDPGLIFRPEDTTAQDLVIVGEETFVMLGSKDQTMTMQTFCAKSYASCPRQGLNFSYWKQADSNLLKVLHFIKQYSLYDGLGQSAVWAMTDHGNLDGVYDHSRPDISDRLMKYMASFTGMPHPQVYKEYTVNEVPGAPAFVPKVLKMFAKFEWVLDSSKFMSLGVFNEAGEEIRKIEKTTEYRKGGHRITVQFEATNVKAGNYYIRLMEGAAVHKELLVKVD